MLHPGNKWGQTNGSNKMNNETFNITDSDKEAIIAHINICELCGKDPLKDLSQELCIFSNELTELMLINIIRIIVKTDKVSRKGYMVEYINWERVCKEAKESANRESLEIGKKMAECTLKQEQPYFTDGCPESAKEQIAVAYADKIAAEKYLKLYRIEKSNLNEQGKRVCKQLLDEEYKKIVKRNRFDVNGQAYQVSDAERVVEITASTVALPFKLLGKLFD